ncbi:cell envelope integrity protein TolA [Pelobacter propionicus]|uniref:Cell division and transport-associated protein TolA n=1 Tax=Pelobacter propionicus (strain DSM 2379 / NBRC 103807 / OttBd1) TaxID=338966 RepID=A1AU96_PELPD|nr:TonB family protein [Pelobacter propionicus]ABL00917.1 Cell division and transport-associated protein TolA [Pelobacter propionicus DSM 2379]
MTARQATSDRPFGISLCLSVIFHALCGVSLVWWQSLVPPPLVLQETYYVDVVNLPVASPRSGSPTQQGDMAEAAPPLPQAEEKAMPLPSPPKPADSGKQSKAPKTAPRNLPDVDSDSFAKKMAKLEGRVASGQHESAVESLRRKVASGGSGRSGMPGGKGQEAGSDYVAYIQSRLKDAFRETISYTSRAPEVVVRISLDSSGRLARKKIERSSGDLAFERSVIAAIDRASEKFPAPPDRRGFEGVFVFKPQGVSNSRP